MTYSDAIFAGNLRVKSLFFVIYESIALPWVKVQNVKNHELFETLILELAVCPLDIHYYKFKWSKFKNVKNHELFETLILELVVCPLNIHYSPAAIIRNTKIWNIILLLAFFRTVSSNLDLEFPAVSEENCLKNLLPLH